MPEPQPVWAQQYNPQMEPAWARAFEPPAVTGNESVGAMHSLMDLYLETGEEKPQYRASPSPDIWIWKNFSTESIMTNGSGGQADRRYAYAKTHPGILECRGDGERAGESNGGGNATRRSSFASVV